MFLVNISTSEGGLNPQIWTLRPLLTLKRTGTQPVLLNFYLRSSTTNFLFPSETVTFWHIKYFSIFGLKNQRKSIIFTEINKNPSGTILEKMHNA
jgi:hypothetical protein